MAAHLVGPALPALAPRRSPRLAKPHHPETVHLRLEVVQVAAQQGVEDSVVVWPHGGSSQ